MAEPEVLQSGPQIIDAFKPFVDNLELWVHRTRKTDPNVFWQGLNIPSLGAGLRSTATLLTQTDEFPILSEALEEFTTLVDSGDSMDNARVFVVAPLVHRHLLTQNEKDLMSTRSQHRAKLSGKFVLAHLRLESTPMLTFNPTFAPEP